LFFILNQLVMFFLSLYSVKRLGTVGAAKAEIRCKSVNLVDFGVFYAINPDFVAVSSDDVML